MVDFVPYKVRPIFGTMLNIGLEMLRAIGIMRHNFVRFAHNWNIGMLE
jgi:hypothetical protein